MKISVIIPAYNEEKTISWVISVVEKSKIFSDIIVVNDGSTDRTSSIVKQFPKVKLIEFDKNKGKGAAVMHGIRNTDAEILLLLDADLVGLKEEHIKDLLSPIIQDEADMTRGYFTDGRYTTDLSHKIAPGISGQRGIKKEIIQNIPDLEKTRFGFEVALNRYIKKSKLRLKKVPLPNLTHIMKEEKFGFKKGVKARFKMYWDIAKYIGKPKKRIKVRNKK